MLSSDNLINFPRNYSYILQSAIYDLISEVLPDLHKTGPVFKKRQFRPFVFSKIDGKYKIINGGFSFYPPISFSFASPFDEIIQAIGNQFLKQKFVEIIGIKLKPTQVIVSNPEVNSIPLIVRTISPITVRSTLTTHDGKNKTYYYNPYESDFAIQIKNNLLRKAEAIGLNLKDDSFSIKLIGKAKQRISNYKGFTIIAWDGKFKLSGNKKLIKLALDWGLGSRNAQGFGMIKFF